ncbi:MAG: element excision factor XisI family protein [Cyanobacteria bacterium J06639_14]
MINDAQNKSAYSDIEVETVFYTRRDHAQIIRLDWTQKRWVHLGSIHLDV